MLTVNVDLIKVVVQCLAYTCFIVHSKTKWIYQYFKGCCPMYK